MTKLELIRMKMALPKTDSNQNDLPKTDSDENKDESSIGAVKKIK